MKPQNQKTRSSPARRPAARPRKLTIPLMKDEFLAMAFRLSPHPIGITELETGRCLEINDACLEIFGFRRDEVIGQTTLLLGIWPDPRERARLIERLLSERSVRNVDVTMRMKNGGLRQFLISTDLVMLGGKRCLLTIGNDITELKAAEEALQQNEDRFRTLVSNIPGAVYRCALDEHWTISYISEAIEGIVGYPAKEFIDHVRTYASVIHPDDRRRVDAAIREAARERRPYVIEYRVTHAKGDVRWVSEKGQGVFGPDGEVRFLDGAIFNVTERKQAEETLRQLNATLEQRVTERSIALSESEERFRAFFDHAANVAFVKSTDGRYLYANRRFEEMFALEQKHILGKTDEELFPREQANQYQANDRRVLESGHAIEFEEVGRYTDGLHTSIVVKFPVRDGLGRTYATGGIATDITDRKKVEDELRQSQEELRHHRAQLQDLTSKLIAAQEHERQRIARDLHDDFSQRLAALVLDVAAIEQQPPLLPERLPDMLCPIRERLEQLSDDIHNLAYKLHPSLLEHAGLRAAVEDHLRDLMNRTALTVSFKAHHVPDSLSLDHSTGLFRVLQESLQNVVKHAKATEVSVKLSGSPKGVGLSVTDNGTGFDAQDTSADQKGLGLINMQERLRLLDGFLRIHTVPGVGTKVCAWIPLKETAS